MTLLYVAGIQYRFTPVLVTPQYSRMTASQGKSVIATQFVESTVPGLVIVPCTNHLACPSLGGQVTTRYSTVHVPAAWAGVTMVSAPTAPSRAATSNAVKRRPRRDRRSVMDSPFGNRAACRAHR